MIADHTEQTPGAAAGAVSYPAAASIARLAAGAATNAERMRGSADEVAAAGGPAVLLQRAAEATGDALSLWLSEFDKVGREASLAVAREAASREQGAAQQRAAAQQAASCALPTSGCRARLDALRAASAASAAQAERALERADRLQAQLVDERRAHDAAAASRRADGGAMAAEQSTALATLASSLAEIETQVALARAGRAAAGLRRRRWRRRRWRWRRRRRSAKQQSSFKLNCARA